VKYFTAVKTQKASFFACPSISDNPSPASEVVPIKSLSLKVCKRALNCLENEGFLGGLQSVVANGNVKNEPSAFEHFRNNTHDQNRPSGRKQQALAHQKFGMTPFDQQNANG
jgi:hypothetical protein